MTPEQKNLVQSSFAQVMEIADTAAELFYNRLFELNPNLRRLFTTDLREQGRKLMQMLRAAIGLLEDLDNLVPALRFLGSKHATYGVQDEDYETVGAALIWTLERGLGHAFTPTLKAAWIAVYRLLAGAMRAAEPLAA